MEHSFLELKEYSKNGDSPAWKDCLLDAVLMFLREIGLISMGSGRYSIPFSDKDSRNSASLSTISSSGRQPVKNKMDNEKNNLLTTR